MCGPSVNKNFKISLTSKGAMVSVGCVIRDYVAPERGRGDILHARIRVFSGVAGICGGRKCCSRAGT